MPKRIVGFLVIAFCALSVSANINLVFRCDDIRLVRDSFQTSLLRTFREAEIPLSVAVVPCDNMGHIMASEDGFVDGLRDAIHQGRVEVALHGLTHTQIGPNGGEFGGLNYKEQYDRLSNGKQFLDSVLQTEVVTFIPPWNSYDISTLKALRGLGFHSISSCLAGRPSFDLPELNYMHCTVYNCADVVAAIHENEKREGAIVAMFHPYDFNESFTMDDLASLLDSVKRMNQVRCLTFEQLAKEETSTFDSQRMNLNLETNWLQKKLHTTRMIQTTRTMLTIKIANMLIYLMAYFVLTLLGLFLVKGKKTLYYVLQLCGVLVVAAAVWFRLLSPMKGWALCIGLSIFICLAYKTASFLRKG